MDQYDRIDAALYDYYSLGLPYDLDFYVEEAKKAEGPVLELGCGTGRILIPTARAGVEITGLDLSPSMLEILGNKIAGEPEEVQQRLTVVEGSMNDFSLEKQFHLITVPFRAFMHLLTSADQRQALQCIHRHLVPGGKLIFNIFDPRLDIIDEHMSSIGSATKTHSDFVHPDTGRRFIVGDTRHYDQENQRLHQYFIFEELDESGRVINKHYAPLELRYAFRFEMEYLLELCGFEAEYLWGDFQRGYFQYGGEQIWVCKKV